MRKSLPVMVIFLILLILLNAPIVRGTGTPNLQLQWSKSESGGALVAISNDGSIVAAAVSTSLDYIKFYDSNGNSLGTSDLDYHPKSISMSYGGDTVVVSTGYSVYVYKYDSNNNQFTEAHKFTPSGGPKEAVLSRGDSRIVVYTYVQGGDYYLSVYDLASSAGDSVQVSPSEGNGLAVSSYPYSSNSYIIAVGVGEEVKIYQYTPGQGLSYKYSISLGSYSNVIDVSLNEYGNHLAVIWKDSLNNYYVSAYKLSDTGPSQIGNGVELSVQEYKVVVQQADNNPFYIIVGTDGNAYILKADEIQDSLTQIRSIGASYASVAHVDISFYGSYASGGSNNSNDYLGIIDVATGDSSEKTSNAYYITGLDLSEDASTLVVSRSSGDLYYYSTGVTENQPVPVFESRWVVIAVVVVALIASYWIIERNS